MILCFGKKTRLNWGPSMKDAIFTRKPSLPHGRRTDIALFAVCFLFLLLFSAFVVAPPQGGTERTRGVSANSDKNPNETCTKEEGGARTVLYADEPFLVAGRSDSDDRKVTIKR